MDRTVKHIWSFTVGILCLFNTQTKRLFNKIFLRLFMWLNLHLRVQLALCVCLYVRECVCVVQSVFGCTNAHSHVIKPQVMCVWLSDWTNCCYFTKASSDRPSESDFCADPLQTVWVVSCVRHRIFVTFHLTTASLHLTILTL